MLQIYVQYWFLKLFLNIFKFKINKNSFSLKNTFIKNCKWYKSTIIYKFFKKLNESQQLNLNIFHYDLEKSIIFL